MTATPRRIAVVTGSRADYGLLRGILTRLKKMDDVYLQIIACGMHLLPRIRRDLAHHRGRRFFDRGEDRSRTAPTIAPKRWRVAPASVFPALPKRSRSLRRIFWSCSATATRSCCRCGRRDAVEHSDRPYPWRRGHGRRVRRRDPPCHHQDGLPAFRCGRALSAARDPDGRKSRLCLQCRRTGPRSRPARRRRSAGPICSQGLGISGPERFLLVTLHPTTARPDADAANVAALLGALAEIEDRSFIFTGVNADPGYRVIDDAIKAFVAARPDRALSLHFARQRALLGGAAARRRRGRQFLQRHSGGAGRRGALDQYRRPPAGPAARRLDHRLPADRPLFSQVLRASSRAGSSLIRPANRPTAAGAHRRRLLEPFERSTLQALSRSISMI